MTARVTTLTDSQNPLPTLQSGGNPKPAIEWIADQFPTTDNFPEELLLLTDAVNGMKDAVSCFPLPFLSPARLPGYGG